MKKKWMSVEEVAGFFEVDPSTVRRWGREGKFSARKVGRRWLFKSQEVLGGWIAAAREQRPSDDLRADLAKFLDLVEELDRGDAAGLIGETQHEISELARSILAVRGPGSEYPRRVVCGVAQAVHGSSLFAFLASVPVPIQ